MTGSIIDVDKLQNESFLVKKREKEIKYLVNSILSYLHNIDYELKQLKTQTESLERLLK